MTALPRQDQLFDVPPEVVAEPTPPPPPSPIKKPVPRESDGVCAIYLELAGTKYKFQGAKDADAWKRMRSVASVAEIEERWRVGLTEGGWLKVATLAQLDQKWNDLGQKVHRVPNETQHPPCDACGAEAPHWYSRLHMCTGCLKEALEVRSAVPLPSPRCSSPADSKVREYQQAADLAVYEWAQARRRQT